MPRIDLSRQAASFLRGLPAKQARQIAEKLRLLEGDPASLPSETLKGYAPLRRAKSGEFRIIFAMDAEVIAVRLIGKRNDDDIHRALERAWKK